MELFKLLGTIAIDGTDAAKNAISNVSESASQLSTKLQNAGNKIADFGGKLTTRLSVPIVGIGTVAVKAAADVKAANSQFEQTFAGVEKQASAAMKKVADESGILETRLQGVGTSIYAFAKASGADSAEAMALMEESLQATADAAAYYDRSLDDTAESLMSFLKGNFANDAALGVSCTETTRNAKAMELFGQKYKDLSEIQKQQTLLKMVTDSQKLSGAMGQASRESDGFENVMGNLKESGKQLAAELGEVLLPTVIKLVQKLTDLIEKFSNMDDDTKKLIVTIAGIVAAIGPVLTVFGKVVSTVGTVISTFSKLSSGITSIISIGGKLVGGFSSIASFATGTLIPALAAIPAPVYIVIAVIGAVVAAGVLLYKNWDEISAFASKCWDGIANFVGAAKDKIVGFFQNIIDFVSNNWQGLLLLLVNPVQGAFKLIYDNCDGFREFFDGFIGKIKETFSAGMEKLKEKASEMKEAVAEKFNNLKEAAVEKLTALKENAAEKFNSMKEAAIEKLTEMKEGAVEKFNNLKEVVVEKISAMKEGAIESFNTMKDHIVTKAKEILEGAKEHFQQLEKQWSEGFTKAKEKIVSIATELKDQASQKIQELKESASTRISEFTQTAVSKFGEMKEKGLSAVQSLASTASEKFASMGDTIREKFTSIAETFSGIFEKARTSISGIVENIKGLFNFEWKLPDIKLPHFKFEWKKEGVLGDLVSKLGLPGVPSVAVEWYAKGGVMNDPTMFGFNPFTGKAMVGGEAGAEAIAPIETLKAYIREAVAESNMQVADSMNAILSLMQQYMPEMANKQLILNTGAIVGELASPMNEELGKLTQMRRRRN